MKSSWHEKIIQIFATKVKLNEEESLALIHHWDKVHTLKRNDFLIEKGTGRIFQTAQPIHW